MACPVATSIERISNRCRTPSASVIAKGGMAVLSKSTPSWPAVSSLKQRQQRSPTPTIEIESWALVLGVLSLGVVFASGISATRATQEKAVVIPPPALDAAAGQGSSEVAVLAGG